MRSSIAMGVPILIIDSARGEKADLSPLTRGSRYRFAFGRRIRQRIEWQGTEPFDARCARPDDVICIDSIRRAACQRAAAGNAPPPSAHGADMPSAPTYQILSRLRQGGISTVYPAREPSHART